MMKCIIVDDEPLAREGLQLKVEKIKFLQLVGQFESGLSASNFLAEHEVDLIFLDIQMPDITGLELLRNLKNPPLIIFTTAFQEYALEGFELDAVDYLLKPIDNKRFEMAANKANEIWQMQQNIKKHIAPNQTDFTYIRANRQYTKLFFKDIIYIEGMKNYATIHTPTEKYMIPLSLHLVLEQLPSSIFARIHKSFIVNVTYVKQVQSYCIILLGGKELLYGKVYQNDFIQNYIKNNLLERKK